MKEEDEESGGPSSSRIAVEKASFGRHCNSVTALTEADGSEKSHLCYLNSTELCLRTSLCMSIANAALVYS